MAECRDDEEAQSIRAMRFFCQMSAVFAEFNRVLFGNFTSGVLLIEFFERGGLDCVKDLVLWVVKHLFKIE
jgi:hypothetical protein